MAQDDRTTNADACSCSHAASAPQENAAPGVDAERHRAVAYLDLWERQIALTLARHRFSPETGSRYARKPR